MRRAALGCLRGDRGADRVVPRGAHVGAARSASSRR